MADFREIVAKTNAFDKRVSKLSEAIEQYKQALKDYDEVATMMENRIREREKPRSRNSRGCSQR